MDDVSDRDDMLRHAIVDHQPTSGIQIDGHPPDDTAVGEGDFHTRAQCRRVVPQFDDERVGVSESLGQPSNQ